MSIGVAVPCYFGHISRLTSLLDSIENQTCKPNKVVVSCSSTKEEFAVKNYSFPLEIIVTEEKKNAAENRNIATSRLMNMDYLTFIDADDVMHPQRIEVLLKVFKETNCDIILHNFLLDKTEFTPIQNIDFRIDGLTRCGSGCIMHKTGNQTLRIHHSQSSIKRQIFDIVKYPEEQEFYSKEDCVFCYRIFSLPNIKNAYIENELSYYEPSRTQI